MALARFAFMRLALGWQFVTDALALHELTRLVGVKVDDFLHLSAKADRDIAEHVPITKNAQEPVR